MNLAKSPLIVKIFNFFCNISETIQDINKCLIQKFYNKITYIYLRQ